VPTHEELARFRRRFNRLPISVRLAFIVAALELAEDLGNRGFDPTSVRPTLRLHKLSGENVGSISFAGQYRAVFHLGEQQRPGHAHIV
jgi:hypothetical protein